MRTPSPLPDPLPARSFSVKEARELGVSPRRLRARDLAVTFRGVRTPASAVLPTTALTTPALTTAQLALAYSRTMPPTQFFSHTTAAELLGLRMPEGYRPGRLHVAAPDRAPRSRLTVGHELAEFEVQTLANGLRVTSPIDTWCSLATAMGVDSLVIMGDGIIRRKSPLASIEQMQDAVAARKGARGTPRLRTALGLMRAGTDSARETMLRLLVVRAGFSEPVVNFPISNGFGAVIAHGDLTWPRERVILEYDGRQHAEDPAQFAVDIRRLDDLMEEGWRVIRVDRELLRRSAVLFGKLRTALDRGR